MTVLSCEQVEGLLGAYALDALTAPEATDVKAHLATCAEHRQVADELRETVSFLALAADEREPSSQLRDRVIASIRSVSSEPAVAEPKSGPVVVPIRRAPRLPRWAPRPAFTALAAGVLLAFGIGTYAGYRLGQQNADAVAYKFTGSVLAPSAQADLIYLKDRHQTLLAVNGLPALAPGQVYEMWLIDKGGQPVPEGVATAPDGRITAQMDADLSKFKQFAITIEPGTRPVPTTRPVLQGSLGGGSA
ncbi:MAG: anti-sigma factor [Candidatus Dormibacter sp.]